MDVEFNEVEEAFVTPRRSRWRLESNTLQDLSQYVVDVQYDYFNKSLLIKVLDAIVKGQPVVHSWILKTLLDASKEELKLIQFSGNGDELYVKTLKDIKLIGHKCNHNYECEGDDLMDHELMFTYKSLETKTNENGI